MADSDRTIPSGASGATSGGGQTSESGTTLHVEAARVRGSEPPAAFAPTGPSAERDFFAERLALFGRIACLASSGFLVMRVVLNAVAARGTRHAPLERFPVFHLVATAILLVIWLMAGRHASSNRGLRRLDAAGTIAAGLAYAVMAWTMPLSWRPDQLVLLIMNAVLLGRAALVPSEPRRTAWISAASVLAIPFVTFLIFRANPSGDLVSGAVVTQAILRATFVVVLATLISNITFHLRRSIARARRLG